MIRDWKTNPDRIRKSKMVDEIRAENPGIQNREVVQRLRDRETIRLLKERADYWMDQYHAEVRKNEGTG